MKCTRLQQRDTAKPLPTCSAHLTATHVLFSREQVTDESWKAIKSRFLSKELPTLKTKDDKWMARRKDNEQGMVLTVKSMPFSSKVGHSYRCVQHTQSFCIHARMYK